MLLNFTFSKIKVNKNYLTIIIIIEQKRKISFINGLIKVLKIGYLT